MATTVLTQEQQISVLEAFAEEIGASLATNSLANDGWPQKKPLNEVAQTVATKLNLDKEVVKGFLRESHRLAAGQNPHQYLEVILSQQQKAKEEAERLEREAKEREEAERLQREAKEREEAERLQREAKEREEAERLQREAKEREEAERLQREAKEREEAERLQREAKEREEAKRLEREAKQREEAERQLQEAQEAIERMKLNSAPAAPLPLATFAPPEPEEAASPAPAPWWSSWLSKELIWKYLPWTLVLVLAMCALWAFTRPRTAPPAPPSADKKDKKDAGGPVADKSSGSKDEKKEETPPPPPKPLTEKEWLAVERAIKDTEAFMKKVEEFESKLGAARKLIEEARWSIEALRTSVKKEDRDLALLWAQRKDFKIPNLVNLPENKKNLALIKGKVGTKGKRPAGPLSLEESKTFERVIGETADMLGLAFEIQESGELTILPPPKDERPAFLQTPPETADTISKDLEKIVERVSTLRQTSEAVLATKEFGFLTVRDKAKQSLIPVRELFGLAGVPLGDPQKDFGAFMCFHHWWHSIVHKDGSRIVTQEDVRLWLLLRQILAGTSEERFDAHEFRGRGRERMFADMGITNGDLPDLMVFSDGSYYSQQQWLNAQTAFQQLVNKLAVK